MQNFDYIVVGSGSAGCVLADRLSANGRHTVLVLEAGGSDRRPWIKTPIGYGMSFYDPKVNWRFHTEPDAGLAGRSGYWPRGKVLGGSSSINALVYLRGLPRDFDAWSDAGNPGWSWREVEPVFVGLERRALTDGKPSGTGRLWISDAAQQYHPVKRYFTDAATQLGLPLTADMNGPTPEGVGAYAINTHRGLRFSAADAFLRPALRRRHVALVKNALVEKVLIQNGRATGVAYRVGGRSLQANALREVVLAAGAVNSPKLLQLSGVGPGHLLQDMGVAVNYANNAVGEGLQDHLGINYVYRATEPTLNGVLGSWYGRLRAGLEFVALRRGPLSLSINQMGGLVKTTPSLAHADVQLYFSPVSYSTETAGKRPLLRPDAYPGFLMGFNSCRPTSTGRIAIASANPQDPPRITPNYLSTAADVAVALAGARLIGRLQDTPSMRALVKQAAPLDLLRASDDAVLADFRQRSGTVYHPCGTCRMAPEQDGGVVDAQLRVYGVQGLRVADASIFPSITSGNTHAPTVMVGAQAARFILANSHGT